MLKFRQISFHNLVYAALGSFFIGACSNVSDVEVSVAEMVKPNTVTPLTIVRTGSGSGEWDLGDKDGFNYYFSSYPAGKFKVDVVAGKENDYCRTTESNEVSDGDMHNEVTRDMLVKEKEKGEITIAIACHKKIYRFHSADSVVNVQMIVEDADDNVTDTVVFKIVRHLSAAISQK
jgi:hypothetical protein